VSRELTDVEVVNRHKLALAKVFESVREAAPVPAPGPFLRVADSGAVSTNRGKTIREAAEQSHDHELRRPRCVSA
jgi:hypothetical protein